MATRTWRGDAPAVAQVTTITVGGTIEATDVFNLTINGKTLSVVGGSTTAATVATNIVAAWNALPSTTHPEFAEITASANSADVVLTHDKAGVPFLVTEETTETGGGAADDQTFVLVETTAATGPNDFDNAANWSGGAVPTTGDAVEFTNSAVDCLYNLEAIDGDTLLSLTVTETYTGKIGLSRMHGGSTGAGSGSYLEYRAQFLKVGITTINIRGGGGRIKLNTNAIQALINVTNTGQPVEPGVPSVLWYGTHASTVVNVNKGSFGAGFYGETATIATLRVGYVTNKVGDASVYLGGALTLTTIIKSGGSLTVNSNLVTLNHDGGETIWQAGTGTTLNLYSGQVRYRSTGLLGTANVYNGGELDYRQDNQARTLTNCTLYDGAALRDPMETVTFTNAVACKGPISGQGARITLELGTDFSVQRS